MVKLKHIVLVEAVVIIVLLGIIIKIAFLSNENLQKNSSSKRLLSSRIYSKLLEPGSYMVVNFDPLKENLAQNINQNKLDISIYVENLKSGAAFGINEKKNFCRQASLKYW